VTVLELQALLRRVDPRLLREEAGIRACTVARALGVRQCRVSGWESGRYLPAGPGGYAWARFTAGLERHAEVTAAMSMSEAA
jgi:hypothetical protein